MNQLQPVLALLMCALPAACATPSSSPTASARPPAVATPSVDAVASDPAPSASELGDRASPITPDSVATDPPPLALEAVATGLRDPIGMATVPDGWLLVHERAGRILALPPGGDAPRLAVDLTDRVLGEGERGLLGLALHPDWPDDPRTFVHYSDRNGDTVVSVIATSAAPDGGPQLDAASETVLLEVAQPFANHNGGQLAFGPDGMLYLGLGDGGSGGDPEGNGQDPTTLLGSILRLDVGPRGSTELAIPTDNPFVDGASGAPEVFLYGLRNPWRFSFDRDTGMLWIADVGQNAYEEVNRIDPSTGAGANFGWNIMEATHCFATPDCTTDGLVLPVAEYGRDLGCSISGGHVYRGSEIAGLAGWYLFSDYCTGILFGISSEAEGPGEAPRVLLDTDASVTGFGESSDGELYVADIAGGTVYRIVGG